MDLEVFFRFPYAKRHPHPKNTLLSLNTVQKHWAHTPKLYWQDAETLFAWMQSASCPMQLPRRATCTGQVAPPLRFQPPPDKS